jgi:hypothetical protein
MKINLDSLVVRPVTAAEENAWDELMATYAVVHIIGAEQKPLTWRMPVLALISKESE